MSSYAQTWFPPSRQNWELICYVFPLVSAVSMLQFFTSWYPMGKTSYASKLNIPGKTGWFLMEVPGFLTLLYTMFAVHAQEKKPLEWQNYLMAGMFVTHYIYRAILSPLLLNPSMSPIHASVALFAATFQILNGASIGCWLGGYGLPPTLLSSWPRFWAFGDWAVYIGGALWAAGLAANIYHDDILREIRRNPEKAKDKITGDGGRVYAVPEGGLFGQALYAHYFCEWVEWIGFWIVGGWACGPARTFVVNEFFTMMPRAWNGKKWYVEKFGAEKIGGRKAAIPYVI